jgi:hypothetical protein
MGTKELHKLPIPPLAKEKKEGNGETMGRSGSGTHLLVSHIVLIVVLLLFVTGFYATPARGYRPSPISFLVLPIRPHRSRTRNCDAETGWCVLRKSSRVAPERSKIHLLGGVDLLDARVGL